MLIAEHSMCQPGRPSPKGASHAAPSCSSPGWAFFHRAKSLTDSLSYLSDATRAPVADVGEFPHRRAARVHAYMSGFDGFEDFLGPSQRVVEALRFNATAAT